MQETNLQKTEHLIREINRIHAQYSQDYFETGKVAKVNLSRTLAHVPTEHILSYRLNLHEAINDYLAFADTRGIDFFYRVKTAESIADKIRRYTERENQYPVNNILNDIFGARVILPSESIAEIMQRLDAGNPIQPEKLVSAQQKTAASACAFILNPMIATRGNCKSGTKKTPPKTSATTLLTNGSSFLSEYLSDGLNA